MKYRYAVFLLVTLFVEGVSSLAVQSGPENGGESVAGGIMYDPYRNLVYITGATDGIFFGDKDASTTNCFLATLKLEGEDSAWSSVSQLGNTDVAESCSSLIQLGESKLIVSGASLEGGVLSELRASGSLKSTVYGMLLQMDIPSSGSFQLEGGHLLHQSRVQYPMSMTRDAEDLYVASIVSEDFSENNYYEPFTPQNFGYGSAFAILVERYSSVDPQAGGLDIQQTLSSTWNRQLGTKFSVFAGGLLYMGPTSLVLVGTAQGTDDAFPAPVDTEDDYDGFVTEINPSTGDFTGFSYRIESQPGRNERVYGSCKHEGDTDAFYVVGITTGNLDGGELRVAPTEEAFIMRIIISPTSGFEIDWCVQFDATLSDASGNSGLQGMACAVTNDGQQVYMVGRVDDGAVVNVPPGSAAGALAEDLKSSGKTDIFIAQMNITDGIPQFILQFGSADDDYVEDVVSDANGNAIVYGTTLGSLYRDNVEGEQDVFVVSVGVDGTFEDPIAPSSTTGPQPTTASGSTAPTLQVATAPTSTTSSTAPPSTATPPTAPAPTPTATTTSAAADDNSTGKGGKIVISIIAILIAAFAIFFVYRRHKQSKGLFYTDEDHVVEYLKGFDDVEVDLKQSATGGWHGTYLNPKYASDDAYSYSSGSAERFDGLDDMDTYVRNSLFMDDFDTPGIIGVGPGDEDDERSGLTRQRSNYDGLVDAYNTTWDDLSPHVMPSSRRSISPKRDLSDKKHVMETIDFMRDDDAWGKEII